LDVNRMMYCLIDASGRVYTKDGANSYADVATEFGIDQRACRLIRVDLTAHRRVIDRGGPDGPTGRWVRAA
jgi:hypothetical protein